VTEQFPLRILFDNPDETHRDKNAVAGTAGGGQRPHRLVSVIKTLLEQTGKTP
jgi:hypothetical protein